MESLKIPHQSKSQKSYAPHPIPAGRENAVCPIAGVRAQVHDESTTSQAKAAMESDPDIVEERKSLFLAPAKDAMPVLPRASVNNTRIELEFVQLNVAGGSYRASSQTQRLVRQIGGVPALKVFTDRFYEKAFEDVHNEKFLASDEDPHGSRFATWIAEKMGDGTPWTNERRTREVRQMRLGNRMVDVSHDRSSAHTAAWHSPKREPEKWGDHFKLDDARVWMRLHFWAAREVGFFEQHPEFMDHYVRLIGHFVSVYSSQSPMFTRESARWSSDPANIQRYLDSGRLMKDIVGKPLEVAIKELPHDERLHTGRREASAWPYEKPSVAAWMKCVS